MLKNKNLTVLFFSFMIQSVLTKSPTPLAEREPKTMTEPLPYYIDSCRRCIILVSLPYNVKHLEVTAVVTWQKVWVFWNKTWRNEGWLDTVAQYSMQWGLLSTPAGINRKWTGSGGISLHTCTSTWKANIPQSIKSVASKGIKKEDAGFDLKFNFSDKNQK